MNWEGGGGGEELCKRGFVFFLLTFLLLAFADYVQWRACVEFGSHLSLTN